MPRPESSKGVKAVSLIEEYAKAPCQDCKDRKPLCHATCENYKKYKKIVMKKKKARYYY